MSRWVTCHRVDNAADRCDAAASTPTDMEAGRRWLADRPMHALNRLGMNGLDAASQLCTLVFTCDLPLLRRYILAGVPIDAGDYDERTALHISACESNLAVVRHSMASSYCGLTTYLSNLYRLLTLPGNQRMVTVRANNLLRQC